MFAFVLFGVVHLFQLMRQHITINKYIVDMRIQPSMYIFMGVDKCIVMYIFCYSIKTPYIPLVHHSLPHPQALADAIFSLSPWLCLFQNFI